MDSMGFVFHGPKMAAVFNLLTYTHVFIYIIYIYMFVRIFLMLAETNISSTPRRHI